MMAELIFFPAMGSTGVIRQDYWRIMKQLSDQQAIRYSRQIMLPGFDLDKQERLLNGHVLQVGAGGLGCACAQYLVAAGVGELTLIDDDCVEESNLQRQVLHGHHDIGRLKSDSAGQALKRINPGLTLHCIARRLEDEALAQIARHCDVIVDCSDNLHTRNQLNRLSVTMEKPLVSGSAIRMEGQLCSFVPGVDKPCYQCMSLLFTERQLSCMEAGIMSPVVGIIGSMQALDVIKLLSDYGKVNIDCLRLYDAMQDQWQQFTINKHRNCPVCNCAPSR